MRLGLHAGGADRHASAATRAWSCAARPRSRPQVLEAAPNLKVVGRAGVGVDNIDVEAATRRGIVVVNAPEAITVATAEHTIGLMLALARHIPEAHTRWHGGWERSKFVGVELRGKTLGLFGLGRIGSEVARRAPRRWRCASSRYDPFHAAGALPDASASSSRQGRSAGAERLHHACTRPDRPATATSSATPSSQAGKPDVRIINVARGEPHGRGRAAARARERQGRGRRLDVFEKEPPPTGHAASQAPQGHRDAAPRRLRPPRRRSAWRRRGGAGAGGAAGRAGDVRRELAVYRRRDVQGASRPTCRRRRRQPRWLPSWSTGQLGASRSSTWASWPTSMSRR